MEHISVFIALKRLSTSQKWFMLAAVLLILFTVYTVILSSGVFTYFTLYQEQWLLHRPLNGFNCVFREWKQLGEIGYSLFCTFLLCLACLFLKYRYRVLILLILLFAITYIDRVAISVAGPRIQADLHIDPIGWGWVTGVFALSYCLFEIPTGALGDRIGPRRVLTRIVLLCYYRDDRVMVSLGLEVRPPFPKGHVVEQGDWSLLDPVRSRRPFWRSASD